MPEALFQSSRSLRTATARLSIHSSRRRVFQSSRSLRTATVSFMLSLSPSMDFNPRGPCGPRRTWRPRPSWRRRNFNPRGPCGPRRREAPHGGGHAGISILAVLADRDLQGRRKRPWVAAFQSSRSLRTATRGADEALHRAEISILAVLADRDLVFMGGGFGWNISILAVLADRDGLLLGEWKAAPDFNPRGPCGPRPIGAGLPDVDVRISILAVLADRDDLPIARLAGLDGISILAVLADRDHVERNNVTNVKDFNPRGPCGPRPMTRDAYREWCRLFQSSRSLRTATVKRFQ